MSLRVFWDSIYELCQESVHREGVDPNSMEGVRDLNHIGVEHSPEMNQFPLEIFAPLQGKYNP